MTDIVQLLSRLLFNYFGPVAAAYKGPVLFRFLLNLTGFLLLVFGYVLGCRVLYHYLLPTWGEPFSLLAICSLLFATSMILFIIAWFSKPNARAPIKYISEIEKVLGNLPTSEGIKKMVSMNALKAALAVFTLAAMASYLSSCKNKKL